jgi:hypothetical protein
MVVNQVKQWWVTRANAARWRPVQEWAESRGGEFRQTREGQGFQIEAPKALPGALRIEWGESQRAYLSGNELRMRCEMGLHSDLQLMALERQLMDRLEGDVFEAYTDTLKTRVDTDTPEEMRWLVMFPKFGNAAEPALRQRFGIVGVTRELAASWVEGDFGAALAQASEGLLPEGHPFVLMVLRGNVYLRAAMPEADLGAIQGLLRLLESAARTAQQLNVRVTEGSIWQTTTAAAFQPGSRS